MAPIILLCPPTPRVLRSRSGRHVIGAPQGAIFSGKGGARISGTRSDPDVAISGNQLVAVWVTPGATNAVRWGSSVDGGNTWTQGGTIPLNAGEQAPGRESVTADRHGNFYCAGLLAGGSGTRLWPLSRERLPKQFLAFDERGTLLQQTFQRLRLVAR